MAFDRFLIAPLEQGLVNRVRPWLIPDEAFAQLNNAYAYRGRVRKRFGSYLMNGSVNANVAQLYSRLRIQVGTTAAVTGNLAATIVPGGLGAIGQLFSIGNTIFTVNLANGAMYTTGAATGTFNTATGSVVITGNNENPLTAVFWYPALPVMGLLSYEQPTIEVESVIGFDTQFSYSFDGTAWSRLGTTSWTGNDSQFFWGTNYRGASADVILFFVVNHNAPDQIKYWDGSVWTTIHPQTFNDGMGNIGTVETARIVLPYKDRLLLLSTRESLNGGPTALFANRCRYSQIGSPIDATAWREDIPGKGGFLDAPTKEAIITAQFVKDQLIVYFERSTWSLVYTNDFTNPFTWQQINTELGAESTFSIVPFDKVALGVGNVGIHACNGANVERIDQKIPDEVFDIHNGNSGVERVYGIRDYTTELVYFTFPSAENNPVYPNKVLVYNYANGSWAFNDDSITAFGYYQPSSDTTWAMAVNLTWEGSTATWNSGEFQSQYRKIIAGNQEGFVFIIDPFETARNAPALQITDISVLGNTVSLTIKNHNLMTGDYIAIENVTGITGLATFYAVNSVTSADIVTIIALNIGGAYTGAGTVTRVSRIDIYTKQYNFYGDSGKNVFISKVEFMVDKTAASEITVDYFVSTSEESMLNQALISDAIIGTSVLETFAYPLLPLEATQTRLWHPVYLQSDGSFVQLRLFFSDTEMLKANVVWDDFELHAMMFHAQAIGRTQ